MYNFLRRSFFRILYNTGQTLRPLLAKIMPNSVKEILKRFEYKIIKVSTSTQNISRCLSNNFEAGINLIGYAHAEMGIGESCRLAANAIQTTKIPFGIINVSVGNPARMNDFSWKHKEINKAFYSTNIFHINAEQMPLVHIHLGEGFFTGHYNIGYWHWELPDFPDEWIDSFNLLHEIWVPSNFVLESISRKSRIPVVRIPHAIEIKPSQEVNRTFFNLPNKSFLFMAMYDTHSVQQRKNPQAVVEAFKLAFNKDDTSVGLVLKVLNGKSNPLEIDNLKNTIQNNKNIYLLEEFFNRQQVNSLINITDCFVSLHRSEGFGLGLAEAMYLGKPVIGTNWSGNTDFMNNRNSCVVDYELIQVGADYGPYKAYQVWADPDVEQAAYFMRKLVDDHEWYRKIAAKGQETMYKYFSPKTVGELVKQRLGRIGLI
ncbi:MAG: glycosyltransferase family 4 protein [Clostridia bacterium]|nr:glycosyltransferase family 4 protein [Clostridia bacterium]